MILSTNIKVNDLVIEQFEIEAKKYTIYSFEIKDVTAQSKDRRYQYLKIHNDLVEKEKDLAKYIGQRIKVELEYRLFRGKIELKIINITQ